MKIDWNQVCSQMAAEWSKTLKRTFEAYFGKKMNEIWRLDYGNENTSNDVFHFSVNILGFEFQQTAFLLCDFFARFDQKSVQTFISTDLSLKISWFYRKMDNFIWFSIIKISTPTNFMRLRSKLTHEMCQRIRHVDGNMTQNRFKLWNFSLFFSKNYYFLEENEKRYLIFYYKNKYTCQFHAFKIKNDFGNTSESAECKFENILNA